MSLGKDVGIGKQDLVYVRLSINFVSERSAIRDQLCPYLCPARHSCCSFNSLVCRSIPRSQVVKINYKF